MGKLPGLRRLGVRGWAVLLFAGHALDRLLQIYLRQPGWLSVHLGYRLGQLLGALLDAYTLALFVATFVFPLAVLARVLRRRRLEAAFTSTESFGLAGFYEKHRVLLGRVLPWLPGALNVAIEMAGERQLHLLRVASWAVFAVATAIATRAGLALLSPSEAAPPEPSKPSEPRTADETRFAAVAVTPASRAVVLALALVSLLATLFVATTTMNGTALLSAIAAYVVAALGAASLFQQVSRIVVGIDGVLILGAGRTRFLPYAELDEVWKDRGDLLLLGRGRVVVRLQLQDSDASRADDLARRLQEAMDRAAGMRGTGAGLLLDAARAGEGATRRLASSSRGGNDYRQPAMAREQLWELVEGPASDLEARTVAARALAIDLSDEERTRLRVAAEHCADPRMRIALEELASEEEEDVEPLEERRPATSAE